MRKIFSFVLFLCVSGFMMSCSSSSKFFQTNSQEPQFNLFHLFDGYPSLKAAWDSIPGYTGNGKMTDMLREDLPTGAEFMYILSFLFNQADVADIGLLTDLKGIVGLVNDTGDRLYGDRNDIGSYYGEDDPAAMVRDLYSLLNEIANDPGGDSARVSASVLAMGRNITDYLLTKSDAEMETTMNDLMTDLRDTGFRGDFQDLVRLAAAPVALGDYPMWINTGGTPGYAGDDTLITDYALMSGGVDSEMGNMSRGVVSLLYGMLGLIHDKTVDRPFMNDMIGRLNGVLGNPEMIKRFIWNLSNHFTAGGAGYGTKNSTTLSATTFENDQYNMDIDNTIFSDSDIKETLRELLPLAGGLFRRDDRTSSMVYRSGMRSKEYPLAWALNNIDRLYLNWDQTQLKESIYDVIRYDALGRDRKDPASGAYAHGILEHLLFVGGITSNFGYQHLTGAREVQDGDTAGFYGQNANGHGEYVGYLTFNDSLFSSSHAASHADGNDTWGMLFTQAPTPPDTTPAGTVYGEVYRSKNAFSVADRAGHRFITTWNYPVLNNLSGPCAGDLGSAAGGNGAAADAYTPYTANGIGIKDLTTWTFGLIARSCMEGEGPYYSTQGAQSSGGSVTYYRPDGSVYAVVDKSSGDPSTWVYTSPVDPSASYDKADPDSAAGGQRWNRFKPVWNTDYYMSSDGMNYYTPIDMSGTATAAGCLTITESAIPNDQRECASHEEAIFRNFQWVMNERKMVLVVSVNPMNVLFGYHIIEGNGITGLASARIYRGNGVWAKANKGVDPDTDLAASLAVESSIPGDYRMTGLGCFSMGSSIYAAMGRGTLTPAIVAQNIVAVSRLAFPRSPLVTSGTDYEHKLLGSRRVDNDAENTDAGFRAWSPSGQGDAVWKKRNALIPLLVALIDNLRVKSDTTNNAVAKLLAGLTPIVKPLLYFNYDISGSLGVTGGVAGVARNCWLPRIKGSAADGKYRYPHSKHLTPDCFVGGFVTSTPFVAPGDPTNYICTDPKGWYGGDSARSYFAPADRITVLSMLTDTDTTRNRTDITRRADGLLATLTQYTAGASGRPDVTEAEAAATAADTVDINRVLYGLEQVTSGLKMEKSRAIRIHEDMSTPGGTITATTKQLDPPEWIFSKREAPGSTPANRIYADMDLDLLLDKVIGTSASTGMMKYHDSDAMYGNGTGDPDWSGLSNGNNGTLDYLASLVDSFLVSDSPYAITGNLFDVLDVLARHNLTETQVKALLYTLAKLLACYDGSADRWVLQGDPSFMHLYDLLATALPNVDTTMAGYASGAGVTKGHAYRSLLTAMKNSMKVGGFVPWIIDTVSIDPYLSGDLLTDLDKWLNGDLISGPNTTFYMMMAQMLSDMGDELKSSPDELDWDRIFEYYGFQRN